MQNIIFFGAVKTCFLMMILEIRIQVKGTALPSMKPFITKLIRNGVDSHELNAVPAKARFD